MPHSSSSSIDDSSKHNSNEFKLAHRSSAALRSVNNDSSQGSSVAETREPSRSSLKVTEKPKTEEIPYCPPPKNYIRVVCEDNEIRLVNKHIKKDVFIKYIRKFFVSNEVAEIDLYDINTDTFAGLPRCQPNEFIEDWLNSDHAYFPCCVSIGAMGVVKEIKPLTLTSEWKVNYSNLDVSIRNCIYIEGTRVSYDD